MSDTYDCPHCGSNKEPFFSRSVPMGFYCRDCGKDVDDNQSDQTMSKTNKHNIKENMKPEKEQEVDAKNDLQYIEKQLVSEREISNQLAQAIEDMFNRDRNDIEIRGIARKAMAAWKKSRSD